MDIQCALSSEAAAFDNPIQAFENEDDATDTADTAFEAEPAPAVHNLGSSAKGASSSCGNDAAAAAAVVVPESLDAGSEDGVQHLAEAWKNSLV